MPDDDDYDDDDIPEVDAVDENITTTTTTTTPLRCLENHSDVDKERLLGRVNVSIQSVFLALSAGQAAAQSLNETVELLPELAKETDRVNMSLNTLLAMRDTIQNQCPEEFPNKAYDIVLDDTQDVLADFQNSTDKLLRAAATAKSKKEWLEEASVFVVNASEAIKVARNVVPQLAGQGASSEITRRLKAALEELVGVTMEVNATVMSAPSMPRDQWDSCKNGAMLDQAKKVLVNTNDLLPDVRELHRLKMLVQDELTARLAALSSNISQYISWSFDALKQMIKKGQTGKIALNDTESKAKQVLQEDGPVPLEAVDQAVADMLKNAARPATYLPVAVHVTEGTPPQSFEPQGINGSSGRSEQ